jgi:hypothetical protein
MLHDIILFGCMKMTYEFNFLHLFLDVANYICCIGYFGMLQLCVFMLHATSTHNAAGETRYMFMVDLHNVNWDVGGS